MIVEKRPAHARSLTPWPSCPGYVRNDEAIYAFTTAAGITKLSHEINIDIDKSIRILMSEILNVSSAPCLKLLDGWLW